MASAPVKSSPFCRTRAYRQSSASRTFQTQKLANWTLPAPLETGVSASHEWSLELLSDIPEGSRACDSFTGEPEKIGIGNGAAFRRQLPGWPVAEGAPIVAVDPNAENVRARRDCAKAGFRLTGIVETNEGPVGLMIFD